MSTILALYQDFEAQHPQAVMQKIFSRNDKILSIGQQERFVYYIESGAVRLFCFIDGIEQNIRFGYEGSFITSLPSFFTSEASIFEIESIRKSRLKCYHKTALKTFIDSDKKYSQAYIEILENLIAQTIERETDLLLTSPADRYRRVLERSPSLFQEVPLRHIANYLRMSPEHLSRLRKS